MKVQIRHIKSQTVCGYAAVYVVVDANGVTHNFGIDYKAAYQFASCNS
jgi:hypothetical protein